MISVAEEAARRAYKDGKFWEVKFRTLLESLHAKEKRGPGYEHTNTSCDGKCWCASPFTKCVCSCDRVNHGIAVDPDRTEEYKALVISKLPAKEVPLALEKGVELSAKSQVVAEKERKEFEQEKDEWVSIAIRNGGCGAELENRLDHMPCGTIVMLGKTSHCTLKCHDCEERAKLRYALYLTEEKRALRNGGCAKRSDHDGDWEHKLLERKIIARGQYTLCGCEANGFVRMCPSCTAKGPK